MENKEATVSYSDKEVTPEQISGFIEDMGFSSFVKEMNGKKVPDEKTPTKNASAGKLSTELPLPMNGGGDVKGPRDQTAKCLLHITVSIMRKSK